MKAPHITRRGFLRTISSIMLGTPLLRAGGILINSEQIKWLGGVVLPRPSSPSFGSARTNLLTMLESNLNSITGDQVVSEYVSDLPNMTVRDFLLQKQAKGDLTFEIQTHALGSFLKRLNGISHNPGLSHWWKFTINGEFVSSGIDDTTLATGDTIRFVLGSDLNDSVTITDSLGDYSKVLISEFTPLWNGVVQSDAFYPKEHGGVWHECATITAPEGSYFVPSQIMCTRHIEVWSTTAHRWELVSSINLSVTANDFIGKSWNNLQETSLDHASTRMIFANTGVGFEPLPGTSSETSRLMGRLAWLRSNRARIRTVLSVLMHNLDGSTSMITSSKFVLKKHRTPPKDQPLAVTDNAVVFSTDETPAGLIEIERSRDLKNWISHGFTSQNSAKFPKPSGDREFFRVRRFE